MDTEKRLQGYLSSLPGGKESTCQSGDAGSISGLGRSPEGGHGNPLQCSCLGNSMDRGAWRATVHGVAKSGMQLALKPFLEFWLLKKGKKKDFTKYFLKELAQFFFPVNSLLLREAPQISHLQLQITT